MKVEKLVVKSHIQDGFYLVAVPSTNPDDNGKMADVVLNKAGIQRIYDIDEKELDEILTQIKAKGIE